MEGALFGLYHRFLGMNKVRTLKEHLEAIRPVERLLNCTIEDALKQVRNSRDFDVYFTATVFGFRSVENLYRVASSVTKIGDIHVPTLFLASLNDPVVM